MINQVVVEGNLGIGSVSTITGETGITKFSIAIETISFLEIKKAE
ncbi:hypothetical protein LV89_04929 [Arcicella aurantiaca]|uniref:Uncharacterized protein n=1 Tax=Arcicella aurantiaca TaxID=591202 RepID=A0A316DDL8_9BACT|nr:hypothetical protein [Arcicella aurantiaca]PWK16114.1 hypothetical protein LV89_04929 [Arcicella aurantiaca]